MSRKIILGTRPSRMAQAVAHKAQALIQKSHRDIVVDVRTYASLGDVTPGDLKQFGGKGAFVKDLEARLLNKEIDCAIHTLKDVPSDIDPHPDLVLCAFLERGDPRDALVMRKGLSAPKAGDGEGLVFGTSAPRRQAQLRAMYQGATVTPLRGNVDSRLRKLDQGEFDGIVVSSEGLNYLGATDVITKIYDPEEMLPAVGQGILCLQMRREDYEKCNYLQMINSPATERIVWAEREMIRTLQGNCHSAIAGYCRRNEQGLHLTGAVYSADGMRIVTYADQQQEALAQQLGKDVGQRLLDMGAHSLIASQAA